MFFVYYNLTICLDSKTLESTEYRRMCSTKSFFIFKFFEKFANFIKTKKNDLKTHKLEE